MEETMEYLEKRQVRFVAWSLSEGGLLCAWLFTLQEEQPTFSYEVIIVNDGSKDKTTEVCAIPLPAKAVTRLTWHGAQ